MEDLVDAIGQNDTGRPILVAGPTASGKSDLALRIAHRCKAGVVNADALQVYARWSVLTARPTLAEMEGVPHHLYGHVARDQTYSVGHWLREVADLIQSGERLVIAGGTGLYFSALTKGLVDIPSTPHEVRAEADTLDLPLLLAGVDTATLARIDPLNRARVQRAWEVLRTTGRGLTEWQDDTGPPLLPLNQTIPIVLSPDPGWLGHRIDARFDSMMASGALDEVRREEEFWTPGQPSSRAIGARELIAHLRGTITLDQAMAQAKTATRHYARRQRKWFRTRMGDWPRIALP